tara:strand:- start:23 stop:616 length:594 start_codon:yes stop_codon:yes gene_type:complete
MNRKKKTVAEHFIKSSRLISTLGIYEKEINLVSDLIYKANKNDKKIMVAGNGGSCADAEHFTGELVCTFIKRNRKPISALSLHGNNAAFTAWSNDFGFETFFKRQVEANGKKGDILFLISTGGGSLVDNRPSYNLVLAAKEAKKRNIIIISLIGKGGGLLKKISDIYIDIKSNETSLIQEAHMSILHCICNNLESKL